MKNNQLDVVWFIIGTQSLYGQKTLNDIALQAEKVVSYLNQQSNGSIKLQLKPLAKQTDEITTLCQQANADEHCLGIVVWLHTFSPAKMWINGLSQLQKPLLQLHTQYNEAIPWETIDMDYMNLNQTAHGGREFGFIGARMRQFHCVVVGHWQHKETRAKLNKWIRVCQGIHEEKRLKIARFGDNMREVAVTEGNKVNAQIQFGYSVNGYSLNELESEIRAVAKGDVTALIDEYENSYCFTERTKINGSQRSHVVDAAKIELGIKHFLEKGGFGGFTTTFENLAGLTQLPGLAVQRLMQQGYGFGAEGDWKTAALLRTMKIMDHGLTGGTSFMEDYTYHLVKNEQLVVGAHMLEVCPSISAQDKPLLDVQPLGIGGKADPARLIFTAKPGPAINVSLIDLGNRFRLIINKVNNIKPPHAMPKLPVACALWQPEPNLDIAVQAWVLAGGAHHSVHSLSLDSEMMQLYANIHGIESILIDEKTEIHNLRNELRWNESSFLHSL